LVSTEAASSEVTARENGALTQPSSTALANEGEQKYKYQRNGQLKAIIFLLQVLLNFAEVETINENLSNHADLVVKTSSISFASGMSNARS
jgi:hypothetical protein